MSRLRVAYPLRFLHRGGSESSLSTVTLSLPLLRNLKLITEYLKLKTRDGWSTLCVWFIKGAGFDVSGCRSWVLDPSPYVEYRSQLARLCPSRSATNCSTANPGDA